MIDVRVMTDRIDPGGEIERLAMDGVGGIATFIGVVRGDGGLVSLTLDHYPAMTAVALRALADEATRRWSLSAATIVHRTGVMTPGEQIVFVGTAAPHRGDALAACAFLIDKLKTQAPFWKREAFADGRAIWVEVRDVDTEVATRWG